MNKDSPPVSPAKNFLGNNLQSPATGLSYPVPASVLHRFQAYASMHKLAVDEAEAALDRGDLSLFWAWRRSCKGIKSTLDSLLSQTQSGGAESAASQP